MSVIASNTSARLVAVQCLHQILVSPHLSAKDTFNHYCDNLLGRPQEGDDYVPANIDLLSKILNGVDNRRQDLVDMILGALGNRETKRLPEQLLLAILLCGAHELMAHKDIDTGIIIADYLTITDGFFQGGEAKIVHGVLDKLAKTLRAA